LGKPDRIQNNNGAADIHVDGPEYWASIDWPGSGITLAGGADHDLVDVDMGRQAEQPADALGKVLISPSAIPHLHYLI